MIWCPVCGNEQLSLRPLYNKEPDPVIDVARCKKCGKQFTIFWHAFDREDYIYTHLAHFFDPLA